MSSQTMTSKSQEKFDYETVWQCHQYYTEIQQHNATVADLGFGEIKLDSHIGGWEGGGWRIQAKEISWVLELLNLL